MNKKSLIDNYIYIVAFYFFLFFLIRLYLGGSLERDEAEQMLLINNFSLGYGTQPPLYTWIEQIFFYIFGNSLVALALLKNLLLFIAYFFIYKSTYILTKNKALSAISIASMFLIPPCAWECQRDLTHTVLALTTSSITLYYVLYLREKSRANILNYILLGILSALMVLSKYNLVIFILALLIAGILDKKLKKIFISKRVFISIFIAFLTLLPHLIWLSSNLSLAVNGTLDKLNQEKFNIITLIKSFFLAIGEVFILYFLIFFATFRKNIKKRGESLLRNHQILVLVLTFLILLLLNATTIKSRWLVVLLFPTIIYFATKLDELTTKRVNIFLSVSTVFMGLIIIFYILRVLEPKLFHKNPRFNYPYREIITKYLEPNLKNTIFTSSLSGGNIKYIYPNLDVKLLNTLDIKRGSIILIDKDTMHLKSQIQNKLKVEFKKIEANYRNSNDKFIIYLGHYR